MNKELQDLAWSCLPKEFKEEVKSQFRDGFNDDRNAIGRLFGIDNLLSDAEGEEMLMVSRKRVKKIFLGQTEVQKCTPLETMTHCEAVAKTELLYTLFGSKCLPDEVANEDNFMKSEPKKKSVSEISEEISDRVAKTIKAEFDKIEPKFKVGDIVRFKYCCTTYQIDGFKILDGVMLYQVGEVWAEESDIEPYTEPETSHETPVCENHSDDTSQKEVNVNSNRNLSQNIVNCDKQFDNILKDSFSHERRLNVAVQMVKAIMQCPEAVGRIASAEADSLLDDILHDALYLTDRLMSECEKGGKE